MGYGLLVMRYGAFHLYVTSLDLLQVCNDQSSLASDSCFSSLEEMHWYIQSRSFCWRSIHLAACETVLNCSWQIQSYPTYYTFFVNYEY